MEIANGTYRIQGLDVLDICKRFGTPLYVYDAQKIATQVEVLKRSFPDNVKIRYAAKALTNFSVLKYIRSLGCDVDVVSIYEARLALKAGFTPGSIIFTPTCVSFDEIVEGVKKQLVVNLDNLPVVEKFGRRYGNTCPCCIRFNPGILAGGHRKMATGHTRAKFGIDLSQFSQLMELVNRYGIVVEGLHVHTGSEIADVSTFLNASRRLFDIADAFPALRFIDVGGGFKVGHGTGAQGTDIPDLGAQLGKIFADFSRNYGRELELWIEPGKYLVSEAGHLFVTVNVVKPTPEVTFVGVNSGFNHFVRPMMYDAYHDIINITNPVGERELYTIVGNICETDTFGTDLAMTRIRERDVLSIENAGAYGYSMASNFNSRPRPAEVMVLDAKPILVRRQDVFEDMLRGQIGLV